MNPVETFFAAWDREAQKTVEMLKMLPAGQYDFRPDTAGRSIGELAWHLAELDEAAELCREALELESETHPNERRGPRGSRPRGSTLEDRAESPPPRAH